MQFKITSGPSLALIHTSKAEQKQIRAQNRVLFRNPLLDVLAPQLLEISSLPVKAQPAKAEELVRANPKIISQDIKKGFELRYADYEKHSKPNTKITLVTTAITTLIFGLVSDFNLPIMGASLFLTPFVGLGVSLMVMFTAFDGMALYSQILDGLDIVRNAIKSQA